MRRRAHSSTQALLRERLSSAHPNYTREIPRLSGSAAAFVPSVLDYPLGLPAVRRSHLTPAGRAEQPNREAVG
jgi:hypothetical protein